MENEKRNLEVLEVGEMLEALEAAQLKAAEYGFSGLWFALEDMAEGLAKFYNLER